MRLASILIRTVIAVHFSMRQSDRNDNNKIFTHSLSFTLFESNQHIFLTFHSLESRLFLFFQTKKQTFNIYSPSTSSTSSINCIQHQVLIESHFDINIHHLNIFFHYFNSSAFSKLICHYIRDSNSHYNIYKL